MADAPTRRIQQAPGGQSIYPGWLGILQANRTDGIDRCRGITPPGVLLRHRRLLPEPRRQPSMGRSVRIPVRHRSPIQYQFTKDRAQSLHDQIARGDETMKSKRFHGRASPRLQRRNEEVVFAVGTTKLTRGWVIKKTEEDLVRPVKTLMRALKLDVRRFKNANDLAKRVPMFEMFDLHRVGETTVYAFGCILEALGYDPDSWADGDLKLATVYAKARKLKKKKRAKKSKSRVLKFGPKLVRDTANARAAR